MLRLTQAEIEVWEKRWQSQDAYLTELAARCANSSASRKDTLYALVECLHVFGESQFRFFISGFSGETPKFQESTEFPPQFALSATIEQIAYDTAVIEQAATQRIQADYLYKQSKPEMLQTLLTADYLAYQSLEAVRLLPESKKILREPTTVLTYFQKSASVRVIPYAPVVLVAIPYSCLHNPRDFLAIPHEVGHYVYRHGYFENDEKVVQPATVLKDRFPPEMKWCEKWFEEIFADVFGALIAGPVIALDFQELQINSSIKDFVHDDGDHPVGILRPYLYINVLKEEEAYLGWATKLRKNWEQQLANRDALVLEVFKEESKPTDDYHQTSDTPRKFLTDDKLTCFNIDEVITVDDGEVPDTSPKPVDIAMHAALKLLKGISEAPWSRLLAIPEATGDITLLYGWLDRLLADALQNLFAPDLKLNDNDLTIQLAPVSRKKGETLFNGRIDSKKKEITQPDPIMAEDWLTVLDAAGWATEGPKCESGGGVCG